VTQSVLATARVILEACPPLVKHRDRAYAILDQNLGIYKRFDAISIPDIQDSAEFGRSNPRVPNLEFGAWLRERTGKPLNFYKVSVACTQGELEDWLRGAEKLGCRDVFVVGGDSSRKDYGPGALSVGQATKIAHRLGFHCGGIIIPTRRREFASRPAGLDELARIQDKLYTWQVGFYSTQLLYEAEWISCLLMDLGRALAPEDFPKIFLTFSPFVCEEDLNFAIRALGVYVPSDVERALRAARNMGEAAIEILMLVWERVSTFAGEIGIPADRLGVNIEYLSSRNPRNVRAAFELADEFGRLLGAP